MTYLAVLLAACAGWLITGPTYATQRLATVADTSYARGRSPTGVVTDAAARFRRRLSGRRTEQAARRAVADLCTALVAELRAGRNPVEALRLAVEALGPHQRVALSTLANTASHGGDVADAMRTASTRPGCRSLAWLAACWQVGAESGAGLAEAVDRLAQALRADERRRHEITAQLAAPRATARLLAFLPVIGIAFATGLGQRPLDFLLGTPYGLCCLILGIAVDVLGLFWTSRLARTAEQP